MPRRRATSTVQADLADESLNDHPALQQHGETMPGRLLIVPTGASLLRRTSSGGFLGHRSCHIPAAYSPPDWSAAVAQGFLDPETTKGWGIVDFGGRPCTMHMFVEDPSVPH